MDRRNFIKFTFASLATYIITESSEVNEKMSLSEAIDKRKYYKEQWKHHLMLGENDIADMYKNKQMKLKDQLNSGFYK